jgi:hypothetical protein
MADEFKVEPWLLMHHPERFLLSPWCMSRKFSFLRPSSMTEMWKTSCMVARDVVHDEFSDVPAKSTQIRTV